MASVHVGQKIKGKGLPWRVVWRDAAGKSHQKTFDRKTEADAFADKTRHELRSTSYIDPRKRRTPFCEQYDAWRAERHVSATRHAAEDNLAEKHLIPRWGPVPLEDIEHADIQRWVIHMRTKAERTVGPADDRRLEHGYSWETVSALRQILRQVLAHAVREKKLHTNPADDVRVPNKPTRDITADDVLDPEEVQRLVDAAPDRWKAFFWVACWLGPRVSETARLTRSDFNLQRRTLLIRGTKTRSSIRTLDLPDLAVEVLEKHLCNHVHDSRSATLLFPSEEGTVMDRSNLRRLLQRTLKEAGLDDRGIDYRQLRHTAASLMLLAGMDPVDIAHRLGHENATMFLTVYAQLLPKVRAAGTDALGRLMRGES
jgi:integrase